LWTAETIPARAMKLPAIRVDPKLRSQSTPGGK
jgi:hypothetical protein